MPKLDMQTGNTEYTTLEKGTYRGCELLGMFGLRGERENRETGEKFSRTMLDLVFVTAAGETFEQGFLTLSFDERANLRPIIEGLGFDANELESNPTIEYEFVDEPDTAFKDLKLYPGRGPKDEYRKEIHTFKINGKEVIGRKATIRLGHRETADGKTFEKIVSIMPEDDDADSPGDKYGIPVFDQWQSQAEAKAWARTMKDEQGQPLFMDTEHLKAEFVKLYREYVTDTDDPSESEFFRLWYAHVLGMGGEAE